ncbi:hypothetical protein A5776_04410 [Mycolicibacterium elephantis]|nr:hypothetical protein A5776_04410 [Mycolicibacterium elephantis]
MGAAVQTVLRLSMTATGLSWALHDGTGVDAPVLDHDRVDVASETAGDDLAGHQAAVRGALAIADASGHVVKTVSLRYPDDVENQASMLRKWLSDLGLTVRDAASPSRLARRRPGLGPHLRAATLVVTGVVAFFAVTPALGGQPEAVSSEQPAASTSVVSVPVVPPDAPGSSLKVVAVPRAVQAGQPVRADAGPVTVTSAPVAAAVEEPAAPPTIPNPVATAQDPMTDALGSVLSALP